jgi:hypothetical protein
MESKLFMNSDIIVTSNYFLPIQQKLNIAPVRTKYITSVVIKQIFFVH